APRAVKAPEGQGAASTQDPAPGTDDVVPSVPASAPQPMSSPAQSPGTLLTLSGDFFRSVAETLADVAEALQHAHDARILHRDLKPSNIMVDRAGKCWIIDFGLAGYVNGAKGSTPTTLASAPGSEPLTALDALGTPP